MNYNQSLQAIGSRASGGHVWAAGLLVISLCAV